MHLNFGYAFIALATPFKSESPMNLKSMTSLSSFRAQKRYWIGKAKLQLASLPGGFMHESRPMTGTCSDGTEVI